MVKTPYETICEPIKKWCEKHYYTDFLVTISIDGHEQTEVLEFDGNSVDFVWLYDWWEGQKDVRILGFSPVGDIKLHNYQGPTNIDWLRSLPENELAKWLFRQTRIAQDIPQKFEKPVVDEWVKWLKDPLAKEAPND